MKKILPSIVAISVPYFLLTLIWRSVDEEIDLFVILSTAFSSILVGVLLTLSMAGLANWFSKKIHVPIKEGEEIIKEDGANHFKRTESVGGKLVLTNKRLIFKSHRYNVQNHEESFDLSEIRKISQRRTWSIFNNGLMLELSNNDSHKFVVNNPGEWKNAIDQQREFLLPRHNSNLKIPQHGYQFSISN